MSRRSQLLALAVAVLGLAASLFLSPIEPWDDATMAALAETSATVEDRALGPFTLASADGTPLPSSTFEGRPVYINFWAEWCEICKAEMPSLDAFARQHSGQIDVLTVAVDDDPRAAFRWLEQAFPRGSGFRVLMDPGAEIANSRFATTGVPETFVLDRRGHLVARYVGPRDFTQPAHSQLVQRLLQQ